MTFDKVIIGAADLRFRLQSKGNTLSKDHDAIRVLWDVPKPTVSREGAELTAASSWKW